jgi:hypothetical protein
MCWHGKLENRKIATEDLKCYKIVLKFSYEPFFRPYYRCNKSPIIYEVGKTYYGVICPAKVIEDTDLITIHEGIHCYDLSVLICKFYKDKYEVKYLLPHGVFLNLGTFSSRTYCKAVLMECTIPKGTIYYMNDKGEIVTEKLIINKVV